MANSFEKDLSPFLSDSIAVLLLHMFKTQQSALNPNSNIPLNMSKNFHNFQEPDFPSSFTRCYYQQTCAPGKSDAMVRIQRCQGDTSLDFSNGTFSELTVIQILMKAPTALTQDISRDSDSSVIDRVTSEVISNVTAVCERFFNNSFVGNCNTRSENRTTTNNCNLMRKNKIECKYSF